MLNDKQQLGTATGVQTTRSFPHQRSAGFGMLSEELFGRMLQLERRRTDRSGRRFVLMLIEVNSILSEAGGARILTNLVSAVAQAIRDTDLYGWHRERAVLGVIFTEVGEGDSQTVVETLSGKMTDALYETLSVGRADRLKLSFHVFPEEWDDDESNTAGLEGEALRVSVAGSERKGAAVRVKRMVDIAGSLAALIFGSPVFLLIALAVKLTSPGPALFRQVRLGQHGRKFSFLKFRSMYVDNDRSIHEEYVKSFIAGQAEGSAEQTAPFKMARDPRITPVGRFLRKTSLDELPQFLNVLKGDMSLVGPRPPITYEVRCYQLWHRRRLLGVKPGLTGLWQVEGRSRVTFDDMVRLDIQYARSWSLWLDFKILLQTPRAVLKGEGAC